MTIVGIAPKYVLSHVACCFTDPDNTGTSSSVESKEVEECPGMYSTHLS